MLKSANLFYEHHNTQSQNYKGFHTYLIKLIFVTY